MPPRYRGTDFIASPADGGQEMLSSLLENRQVLAPARTGALLARCSGFRSLDEHTARICQAAGLSPERAAAIRRRLQSLAETGLLTSDHEIVRRCRSHAAPEAPAAAIAILGVPSCDRTDILTRCVRSYMRNSRAYGRDIEFVVMDDSRSAASRAENLAMLTALQRENGTRVSYAAAEERAAYARAVAGESGLPIDTVEFGLASSGTSQVSTGSCRNALLLHAVGDRFIHVDDDTVCNVASAPHAQRGLAVASTHAGMEHFFFATGEEARAAVSFTPQDYFGLYEPLLGKTVADVMSTASPDEPIDLDLLQPEFARQLLAYPSRITVVSAGVVGDSGFGSTEMYFFIADAASRARLLGFPGGGHHRAFETHEVVRATGRTTVAETGLCVGIGLGLDSRELLPPFMPVLRNSDGVFSHVRRVCFPGTSMAFLPWVVEHTPPTSRRSSLAEVIGSAGRIPLSVFLSWLIKTFDATSAGQAPERRLAALGHHLVDVGSLAMPDYIERCREILRTRLADMCRYVDAFDARCAERSEDWRRDLTSYLATARDKVDAADAVVPRDLARSGMSPSDAVVHGQRLVRSYGDLLCVWPAIVDAARALHRRGQRPARRLS